MKKKALIYSTLTIAILIIAILIYPKIFGKSSESTLNSKKSEIVVNVNAWVVSNKPFENKVVTTGSIISNEEVELHSEISGRIIKIAFQEGKNVRTNDLLVKLYDADLQAQLKKAIFNRELLQKNEVRQKTLLDKKAVSQESYDNALNELNQINADIEYINSQIRKTEIHAPFDGIVGIRYISEGAYVTPDTKIANIQNTNPIKIDFSVPQSFFNYIKSGNSISFRLAGKSDLMSATIYAVEPKIDINTRTLQVRAVCPNNGSLTPGAYIEVELNITGENSVISIPSDALIPDIDGEIVYLYQGGKAIQKRVVSGIRNERDVQILSGLNEGDTLIVSGIIQLKQGISVKLLEVK